jgi:hypothetical protein
VADIDSNANDPTTRRRSVKRTVAVLVVIAGIIYIGFIGRGVFGIGS